MAIKKVNFDIDGKEQSYAVDKIKKFKPFTTHIDTVRILMC